MHHPALIRIARRIARHSLARATIVNPDYIGQHGAPILFCDEEHSQQGTDSSDRPIPDQSGGKRLPLSPIRHYQQYFKPRDVDGPLGIPYHIIFTKHRLDVETMITPEQFKEILEHILHHEDPKHPAFSQAAHLYEHFDEIFRNASGSINIIANEYEETDFRNPEAIDHDIGHKIINHITHDFSRSGFWGHVFKAVNEEFHAIASDANEADNKAALPLKDVIKSPYDIRQFLETLLSTTLFSNPLLPESISAINISNLDASDLIPDIMPFFRATNGDLSQLIGSAKPIPIYWNNKYFDIRPPREKTPEQKSIYYKIVPKPGKERIPKTLEVLGETLDRIGTLITKALNEMKGKIISLW